MSKTIWKYEIPFEDNFTVKMPMDSQILSAQIQETSGLLCIWALVQPENRTEKRTFELIGTGHPIPSDDLAKRNYIATCQCNRGELVVHVFERIYNIYTPYT